MKNSEEVWKDVKGYENLYKISSLGRIKNAQKNTFLKQTNHSCGYLTVELRKNKIAKKRYMHRLVAEAFIPNPDNLTQVNHKNENKKDNNIKNLEWCSPQYNSTYGTRLERFSKSKKKRVLQFDLDENFIKEWKSAVDIQKETGFEKNSIGRCCRNQQYQAYGYIWRYANENQN